MNNLLKLKSTYNHLIRPDRGPGCTLLHVLSTEMRLLRKNKLLSWFQITVFSEWLNITVLWNAFTSSFRPKPQSPVYQVLDFMSYPLPQPSSSQKSKIYCVFNNLPLFPLFIFYLFCILLFNILRFEILWQNKNGHLMANPVFVL